MSKDKNIVRLNYQGMSQRSICRTLKVSDRRVRNTIQKMKDLNLTYDDIKDMDDDAFDELFTKKSEEVILKRRPDCKYIHEELKRKGVTLMLLWEEYAEECIALNESYLKYTQFCNVYKSYVDVNKLTMHIDRKPGERCEVDWAGTSIPIYDRTLTNVMRKAYLFVGVLPFSQYMFAQATMDMKEESWINHHVDMYNFFGGVPLMCICDNCKTAVISHKKYEEIILNPAYYEMAEYYATAIVPARVRHPKDKNSTEGSVGYITRQIIARLRDVKFSTLAELNERIIEEVNKLNDKPFQKRDYSRSYVFENEEKEYLSALPELPYEYAVWKKVTVSFNYHIQFERNYYSVPYQYFKKEVQIRITSRVIEIYDKNVRIATHPRILSGVNKYVTNKEHMPEKHRAYGEWNQERILNWAKTIGPNTYKVILGIFMNARVEQQVYNQCITILKLKDKYSSQILEQASGIFIKKNITPIHRNFKAVIENIQEMKEEENKSNDYALVRGASYYGGYRND